MDINKLLREEIDSKLKSNEKEIIENIFNDIEKNLNDNSIKENILNNIDILMED